MKGVLILPFIVHFLTKEDLGIWRIFTTTVTLCLTFVTINVFDGAGVYLSSDFDTDSVTKKFNTLLNCSILIFSILILPVGFFLYNFGLTQNYWLLIIASIVSGYLLKIVLTPYQAYQKGKILLFINFFLEYGSAILSILYIYFIRSNYFGLIIPIITVQLIAAAYLAKDVFSEFKYKFYIDKLFFKKIVKVSIPLLPVFLGEWVLSSISVYYLGIYRNLSEVGSFTVAISVASLFLTLRATLQYFWFSTSSNLIQNNKMEYYNNISNMVIKTYTSVIVIGLLVYTFFIHDIISILASSKYLDAQITSIILAVSYGYLVLSNIYNGMLYAIGKTKFIFWSYLLSTLFSLLLNIILVPRLGIIGAAISTLGGYIVLYLSLLVFARRIIKMKIQNYQYVMIISIILCSVFLYFMQFVNSINMTRIVGIVLLALIMFLAVHYRFFDFRSILNLYRKKADTTEC